MGSITDKLGHGYGPDYEALAKRHPTGLLVEVGIADGAGLRYFREIGLCDSWLGVDHNRNYVVSATTDGFYGICAEQDDPALARALVAETAQVFASSLYAPTVIVDDASHAFEKTITTFNNLWPILAPGGTYVIEDWSHLHEQERYEHWYYGMHQAGQMPAGLIRVGIDRKGLIILRKDYGDTEPGCSDPRCVLEHPHAGPSMLRRAEA